MLEASVRDTLKKNILSCKILGVDIAAIDMDWLLRFTVDHLNELSGDYMCVANVHTTVTAFEDETYKAIQNGGVMAIPDGGPLSSLAHRRGCTEMQRTTGPSYLEKVLELSNKNGYSHFFYGATQDTLDKLAAVIEHKYPGVRVAGMYSPPFRPLSAEEDSEVVSMINSASPDFLWVGLGAPKQECWMAAHQGKITGFMVGVGAAFDYLAGNISRAPEWMQRNNLEWFYRLFQDPKRLFKRYLVTNTKFIWNAVIKGK